MPRNGSGSYSLPQSPFVPGTTISSTSVNSDFSDIASALTGSVAADGQTPITGPFIFLDGAPATPSVTFTTNPDDGFYHPGAGQVGVAVAGLAAFIFAAPSATLGAGLTGSSGAVLSPIGVVQDFAGTTAPTGWFLCYGQAISRATYSELFAVIGTNFGIGDGTTTFNVPDARGRVGAGKDDMGGVAAGRIGTVVTDNGTIVGTTLGSSGGSSTHAQTVPELISHTHTDAGHVHAIPNVTVSTGSGNVAGGGAVAANGGGTSTQPGFAVLSSTGGSAAMAWLQPTIILNKIIFAGHP